MKRLITTVLFLTGFAAFNNCIAAQDFADSAVKQTVYKFYSGQVQLTGILFAPKNKSANKLPAIIMAPGFSGTVKCSYQIMAEDFAKAGFAVLLFDYPNFGLSEGMPRQEADPWVQVQAYRDGISYLTQQTQINADRIGIWGGSYSGGHAIVVSALDKRVKCMVSMTPFISGSFYLKNMPEQTRSFLQYQFNADRANRLLNNKPAIIPVVSSNPQAFCAVSSKHAWDFVESIKNTAPEFKNEATLKSLEMQLEYEPGYYVSQVDSIPKLFIVATKDELVPEFLITDTYNKASGPKKLVYIEGHHFSPYMEKIKEAAGLAIKWFKENL